MSFCGVEHVEYKRRSRPVAAMLACYGQFHFSLGGLRPLEAFADFGGDCEFFEVQGLSTGAGDVYSQVPQCECFVASLASGFLPLGGHSRRFVHESYSGFDLVLALPARSGGFVRIYSAIFQQVGLVAEQPLVALIHAAMLPFGASGMKQNPKTCKAGVFAPWRKWSLGVEWILLSRAWRPGGRRT